MENMFGKFNEATQLKTSFAKYSIEFNDLAVQMRPHRIAYLRLLAVCEKVCGQTRIVLTYTLSVYRQHEPFIT